MSDQPDRATRIALRLFPGDFHDGRDCRSEINRKGEPCRICADELERWNDRVTAVRSALELEADDTLSPNRADEEFWRIGMSITKGQKWRYIGGGSEFYTPGKVYEVLSEPGDYSDMFQMTDDLNDRPHHWTEATLLDLFERAESPVRTITRKEIVPGEYGILRVRPGFSRSTVCLAFMPTEGDFRVADISQLRAAAATLTEIADALGEAS